MASDSSAALAENERRLRMTGRRGSIVSFVCSAFIFIVSLAICNLSHAQDPDIKKDLELVIDLSSATVPTPKLFSPNIDLSGRGAHPQADWPQQLASQEALEVLGKGLGFRGLYRIQYNLWDMHQAGASEDIREKLLSTFDAVIHRINECGGVVILDIFGTPAGLGKVLDKRSAPFDLRAFKAAVKKDIRRLSCDKKYNVWYEVWSAPDLEAFFLGRQQEYLAMYRVVSEAISELEAETKIHIPLGGPSVSWWYRNLEGGASSDPEQSLIYALIRFAAQQRLQLDFISWHAYSTDPKTEQEITRYKKNPARLIRDWLSYFNLDTDIFLLVDEWNYDSGPNRIAQRQEKSHVAASYIPSRLKNMYEAGVDNQIYFSLEDFQNNKEGVKRNTGLFWYDPQSPVYSGGPKTICAAYEMLASLGESMFTAPKTSDDALGVIGTKKGDGYVFIIYNYSDPQSGKNYLTRSLAAFNDAERKLLMLLLRSGALDEIIAGRKDMARVKLTNKMRQVLKKAVEAQQKSERNSAVTRPVGLILKNLQGDYQYRRRVIDSSCGVSCEYTLREEKIISAVEGYQEKREVAPYSVTLIELTPRAKEEAPASIVPVAPAVAQPELAPESASSALPAPAAVIQQTENEQKQ